MEDEAVFQSMVCPYPLPKFSLGTKDKKNNGEEKKTQGLNKMKEEENLEYEAAGDKDPNTNQQQQF